MYKACSRCGKIHDSKYTCIVGKQKYDYSRYAEYEERKARNTAAWANKSKDIRTKANYLCEVCRDRGIYNYENIEVHHITKLRDDINGLLDDNNLICLCQAHHKQADKGMIDADYLRQLARKREEKS